MNWFFRIFFDNKINNPSTFFIIFGVVSLLTVLFDLAWKYLVMSSRYNEILADIKDMTIVRKIFTTIGSYLGIIFIIVFFSLPRVSSVTKFYYRLLDSIVYGGILGLLTYGSYSLKNMSLINNWSIPTVGLDTLWGFLLFTSVTFLSSFLYV